MAAMQEEVLLELSQIEAAAHQVWNK